MSNEDQKVANEQSSLITTGEFPKCNCCRRQFINPKSRTLCMSCWGYTKRILDKVEKVTVGNTEDILRGAKWYGQLQILELLYMAGLVSEATYKLCSNPLHVAKVSRNKVKNWDVEPIDEHLRSVLAQIREEEL